MNPRANLRAVFGAMLVTGITIACSGAAAAPANRPAPPSASQPAAVSQASGDVEAGKRTFVEAGCAACHVAPGVPEARGTLGPNLAGFAGRRQIAGVVPNSAENLARWLANPQAVKPGTAMPSLNLSQQQVAELAAYLQALR